MKSSMTAAAVLVGLLAVVTGVHAMAFYVSPSGNDTNPGTLARPWLTIGKAARTMVAGDSVLIRAGTYREGVNPGSSGAEGAPITYASYNGEEVIVEGNREVTGWVPDSGNRWKAVVTFTCDPRFYTSRDPNGNHGGLVLQDSAKLRYAMSPSPAAVDSPGEYYMYDSLGPPCTLYVYVRDLGRGYDPNNYRMSLGRVRKGFDLDGGEDWLVADGLTFRNYNDNAIHSIGSNNCVFRNVTTYTNFITGIYLTSGSNNCLIERCKFWDNGHGGIELASTRRTTIRKNWFLRRDRGDGFGGNGAHMWLGPVGALADSNLIENNLAFATGRQSYRGPFLAVAGSYNVIRHNSIACPGGAFALLDGGHNVLVNNACDFSGAVHGIAVFPNAVADSGHFIRGNDLYALDPFEEYWWNNVRFSSVAAWESAAAQTGNFDTLPGFADPIAENLHLTETSFCLDQGTDTLAAGEDFDGVARPVGPGYDIGAYEFLPTGAGEGQQPTAVSLRPAPTIVRGVLWLGGLGHDPDSQGGIGSCPAHLLDISGRKVLDLHSGANDVSRLAPGVYFVWAVSRGLSAESCHKVVIQR